MGLRWKRFIPATTGGSGADIVVVTERGYSPELKIQLLARIIDPRAGDTGEVVTNLDRGEPDPSEFHIPADYKIETVVARGKQAKESPTSSAGAEGGNTTHFQSWCASIHNG
jgi:hypothetical protein